jgi:hypothetical protein
MTLKFGVFDHIEPVPGLRLDQIYRQRLLQIERLGAGVVVSGPAGGSSSRFERQQALQGGRRG